MSLLKPTAVLAVLAVLAAGAAAAQTTVVSSKHDLSVTGPGPIRSTSETQVCLFCHVSHRQGPGGNRPDPGRGYQPYQSSTLEADVPSSPTGASRICLSCHDGTIALGATIASGLIEVAGSDPYGRLPAGRSNLGTDLRRTHPISFTPRPSTRVRAPQPPRVQLDRTGAMQCTSCHDPHSESPDGQRKMFLVDSNRHSSLCLSCHLVVHWSSNPSSHQSSRAEVDPSRTEARFPFATVAENGCESCHSSHNASEDGRLIRVKNRSAEQQVCLDCHTGRVAKTDLVTVMSRPFNHQQPENVPQIHDAAEGPGHPRFALPEENTSALRHVTCVDCHNPHAAYARRSDGVQVSGALAGVWGIDARGERVDEVRYEYEICFKCHGDSTNRGAGLTSARGLAPQRGRPGAANLRLAFAPEAPSSHPVVQPARNADVPSLKAPPGPSLLITCTDCHNSDTGPRMGGQSPNGPHGSNFEFMLERNYSTRDHTTESESAYALCYKCHDRDVLLSGRSAFVLHRQHVVDSATPCSACHTAHGTGALEGTESANARLIDFDTALVAPGPRGTREYTSFASRSGTCSVSCHGKVHDRTPY